VALGVTLTFHRRFPLAVNAANQSWTVRGRRRCLALDWTWTVRGLAVAGTLPGHCPDVVADSGGMLPGLCSGHPPDSRWIFHRTSGGQKKPYPVKW